MPIHWTWKKIMNGTLAVALVAGGGTAVALTSPVSVSAQEAVKATWFTDVQAGYWAEKHIAKLALQGIITGYYNAATETYTFKPGNNVSQQEAVVMALRFAGLDKQIDTTAIIEFNQSFVVYEFYKPYIDLAFNMGLLDRNEEYAQASADVQADPAAEWGTKPASREWVTKLIVSAIEKRAVAEMLQHEPSQFRDGDSVDERYKGYVNAAVQLGLVKGMTPETFEPKSPVNRASLAALFSRAQAQYPIEYEGQSKGVVSKLTADSLTLYSGGTETAYRLTENTLYYHYNTETPISKDQLIAYGDALVIAENGEAKYVEVTGETQHTESVTGTFDRYDAASNILWVWIDNKPVNITYNSDLVIEDETGKTLAISEIKRDSNISIVRDTFREQPVALKIVATSTPTVSSISGNLLEVSSSLITINSNDTLVTKYLAPGYQVFIEGLANPTVNDLIAGRNEHDIVELSLNESDQVTNIKVLNRKVEIVAAAKIVDYDADERLIVLRDTNNKAYALSFSEKTTFDYLGTKLDEKSAMAMLKNNQNVVIHYTHDQAVSVKFVLSYSGTLNSIDTKEKMLYLQTDEGYAIKLPYENAIISDQSKLGTATHLDLKTGDKLTLQMKMDKIEVMTISVHRTIQYEVVSIDSVNKKVRLKNATTNAFDLFAGDVEVLKADGSKGFISSLAIGSKLNVSYVGYKAVKMQSAE
jgi:S-layer homology domain.